jgi:hypothetical protein
MNKQYIYPLTAVICAVVLGGSFLGVQINKQDSIERQAQAKIDLEYELDQDRKAEESLRKLELGWCLDDAEEAYWSYIRLNGTEVKGKEDVWNAYPYQWDTAQERKDALEDKCFKQYK